MVMKPSLQQKKPYNNNNNNHKIVISILPSRVSRVYHIHFLIQCVVHRRKTFNEQKHQKL